jgi:outer membrane protein OmpA-like peptidoglycan-associated protein
MRTAAGLGSIVAVVLALLGCAAAPTTGPAASPTSAARRASALDTERQWLQSWFGGTPVLIAQHDDDSLSVDVPLEFCFETGRSGVKPPLGVVLDKVAESLRRNPLARLQLLAAPGDDAHISPLAQKRAVQVRKRLLAHGVPVAQLGKPTGTVAAAVQLSLDFALP